MPGGMIRRRDRINSPLCVSRRDPDVAASTPAPLFGQHGPKERLKHAIIRRTGFRNRSLVRLGQGTGTARSCTLVGAMRSLSAPGLGSVVPAM